MPDRIERMAVALHTGESRSHNRLPGGIYAVDHCGHTKFLVVCAAFVVGHGIPVKCRGDHIMVSVGFSAEDHRRFVRYEKLDHRAYPH
jgi:hypothetical protein